MRPLVTNWAILILRAHWSPWLRLWKLCQTSGLLTTFCFIPPCSLGGKFCDGRGFFFFLRWNFSIWIRQLNIEIYLVKLVILYLVQVCAKIRPINSKIRGLWWENMNLLFMICLSVLYFGNFSFSWWDSWQWSRVFCLHGISSEQPTDSFVRVPAWAGTFHWRPPRAHSICCPSAGSAPCSISTLKFGE